MQARLSAPLDHRVLGNGLSTSSGTLPGRQWHTIY
jgi:hypothetical protein